MDRTMFSYFFLLISSATGISSSAGSLFFLHTNGFLLVPIRIRMWQNDAGLDPQHCFVKGFTRLGFAPDS
jgi:hypothetical protein